MRTGIGISVVVAAGAFGLFVLARWRRLPARVANTLACVGGAALGIGALLLQDDPEVADWAVTLGALVAFTPLHMRMLVGPAGRVP